MSRRAKPAGLAVALGAALGLAACIDVADRRARRDLEVGLASADGIEVRVENGAAAVRSVSATRVHLWLQAPDVRLELGLPAGAPPVELVANNVLADATLAPISGDATIADAPGPIPTEKVWTITPPPGAGPLAFRIAPPDADTTGRYRFGVFADVQEAIDSVQDIYRRMAADPTLRFVVMSGDLTRRGTSEEFERFQEEMRTLPIPIYATLGNHELGTRDDLFHEYFGRGNTSFVFRGVQFTLLDSASATIAPVVYGWLERWLQEGLDRVHFVYAHIPPLDPIGNRGGAFASRLEANKLLSLLASGKVDVTFYGHVHSYYAFTNAEIPAFITGGGGAIPEKLDGIGRHFLSVDVDPASALVEVAIVYVD